jgi:hypothetical protein
VKEDLKFKIQIYLFFVVPVVYGLLLLISPILSNYFDFWDDIMKWSLGIPIILGTIWGISYLLFKTIKGLEEDRIENKRNIIFQYFFIVPKKFIFSILYTFPFIFIVVLFFIVGEGTSFYTSFCLPLLGGVIGEVIWGLLFSFTFCFLVYQIYKQINRRF